MFTHSASVASGSDSAWAFLPTLDARLAGLAAPYIKDGFTRMVYHRTFKLPKAWRSLPTAQNVMLHVDRVDWEAEVFVNGVTVGLHRGA